MNQNTLVKLTHFNRSTGIDSENILIGSNRCYNSPEEIRKEPLHEKSEIWNLGVILYYLVNSTFPLETCDSSTIEQVEKDMLKIENNLSRYRDTSEEVKTLIMRMLTLDPNTRISSEELFNHPWVQRYLAGNASASPLDIDRKGQNLFKINGFANQSCLGIILYDLYVKRFVPNEEKITSYRIFDKLDKTGSGKLTLEEIYEEFPNLQDEKQADFKVFCSTLEFMHDYKSIYQKDKKLNIKEQKKCFWNCFSRTNQNINVIVPIEREFDTRDELHKIPFNEIQIETGREIASRKFYIKWSEFVTATVERENILTPERIKKFFKLFDKEGKKEIRSIDLINVFDRKLNVLQGKWDELISEALNDEKRNINLNDMSKLLWNGKEPIDYSQLKW